MMTRLFTPTGEIRYLEAIKASLLLAFLFAVIAKAIGQLDTPSIAMSGLSIIVILLYVIQLIVLCTNGWNELWDQLKSYVILVPTLPRIRLTLPRKIPTVSCFTIVSTKPYLRNNVIRC